MQTIKGWIRDIWTDPFLRYLTIALVIIGALILLMPTDIEAPNVPDGQGNLTVDFFYHPDCPHCKEQKPFNVYLGETYPDLRFVYHNVEDQQEADLLKQLASERGIENVGVPATFFGDQHYVGFNTAATSGKELEAMLQAYINGERVQGEDNPWELHLPIFGTIDVLDYSLPLLAIILGAVDGFNPCAMWVLVCLISLIMAVNDRRRIWILVGSFVFASGVLYFLFMTAWLNAFLLIGFMRPVKIIVGLFALGFGIASVKEFVTTKGALACKVTNPGSRKKTIDKMRDIVTAPLTITTVFGILVLAFVVNSIEFACSAAIPAVYTGVLAMSGLSTAQYYLYILLYVVFFMLDDLIIFGLAAFAVNTTIGDKYAKHCKLIGGLLMLAIGVLLVFFPWLI